MKDESDVAFGGVEEEDKSVREENKTAEEKPVSIFA